MMQQDLNKRLSLSSFLNGANFSYIEDLYKHYKTDPSSVCEDWHRLFLFFDDNSQGYDQLEDCISSFSQQESVSKVVVSEKKKKDARSFSSDNSQSLKDFFQAMKMIDAYRSYGHFSAHTDPLGFNSHHIDFEELSPAFYGFTEADYNRKIFMQGILGFEYATIIEILETLSRLYCSNIGMEFMHIINSKERDWIRDVFENPDFSNKLSNDERKSILNKLVEAEGFEKFIDIKYKGAKRFGADGSEVIIPAIEEIIRQGVQQGVDEMILGMAHRGRLNVLSQVMNKPPRSIFYEFKGEGSVDKEYSGDVKYHLGACCSRQISGKNVDLLLCNNPSHLEFVDSVAIGSVRARQDLKTNVSGEESVALSDRSKVLPIIIHGDAAFIGQGVVSETLALSGLHGYTVAGNIHLIVNNQIGFTTNPSSARSSPYSSDIAKSIGIPIFHVNGDDPESVIRVIRIAVLYRMKFHKSVVIDILCYRRFGHNECDEPSFTQPVMYQRIRSHKSVLQIYADTLVQDKVISTQEFQSLVKNWRTYLEKEFKESENYRPEKVSALFNCFPVPSVRKNDKEVQNGFVSQEMLKEIGSKISCLPNSFKAHKIVERLMKNRREMIEKDAGIDWAMAEALAFGSLCCEGYRVRLSGQDCERGTFSHRHSVLYDQETEKRYVPLNNILQDQGHYEVVNSLLSEQAVLGFEYGYSLENPNSLTIWEAQFGDFANGAQIILDQFVSSGEQKWLRVSHLVCLLPHGYEGQGPEHSSARLERFLQMCAENNMRVANCTSPANYFHILRRQIYDRSSKPLIMMTPKSLLRHKQVVSTLTEMSDETAFQPVLSDHADCSGKVSIKLVEDSRIRRVILCTGKVYYDLLENRNIRNIVDIYLIRIEQLYPFPKDCLKKFLLRFAQADMVWCQEEPQNMGAWAFIEPYLEKVLGSISASCSRVRYVGRPQSASTAVGNMSRHLEQLSSLVKDALE
ncbi:2-oxoglutarate dehydrogenase E1 component [Candidatus Liberibacter solanacearum]|uniref:2-oxoglutarate dehydrogenase E1 component n=1 Tax=Candidatus Liberibacter solanacearum TaxID=556287 RepID=A0A1V2N9G9_9HYPH|nr:2-oxoglutarate dehydrogenase E1 component [Candidatus Liberibacter solanacearum]ONI58709.1 2-oxoglutarate dehydrogenase E1 component [Candidatus Liberibacter solanacearum]ONI60358.1 2-oxoglutarate dehydrogenase E1 component [Candidatus Liberibacter solanacearum]